MDCFDFVLTFRRRRVRCFAVPQNLFSVANLTIKLVKFTAINDRRGFIRLATYFLKEKLIQMLETEPLVAPISNCLSSSCIE